MPAAVRSRVCSSVSAWAGVFARIAMSLIKRLEKKLDGNYTRMLRAILNKS